ncbi:MAG: hypothetical protein O2890_02785 [Cyanobacteria bacterium]|nr:hypothetical protein [Cyanobacteriota bacterium]MDA0865341.1 hypothetical protein [Cyanobacteriota bacterium]
MRKNVLIAAAALTTTLGIGLVHTLHTQANPGHGHHGEHTPTTTPAASTDAATDAQGHGAHGHHGNLEIPADQPVPTVTLTAHPDPVSGWNLEVQTEHWTFAPERVNQSSLTTEGHGHLYVNGEKMTRLYSTWTYLPSLPPGENRLTVGLNANGHEGLTHNGEPIEATVVVDVPALQP